MKELENRMVVRFSSTKEISILFYFCPRKLGEWVATQFSSTNFFFKGLFIYFILLAWALKKISWPPDSLLPKEESALF
jgi:hypothetical protein